MDRKEALEVIKVPYPVEKGIVDYTIKKLNLTNYEFDKIMNNKNKSFLDYPTYYPLIQFFRLPIKIACNLNIFPHIFYYKYGVNHAKSIRKYWEKYNMENL